MASCSQWHHVAKRGNDIIPCQGLPKRMMLNLFLRITPESLLALFCFVLFFVKMKKSHRATIFLSITKQFKLELFTEREGLWFHPVAVVFNACNHFWMEENLGKTLELSSLETIPTVLATVKAGTWWPKSESVCSYSEFPQPVSSSIEPPSPAQYGFKTAFVIMKSCWKLYFKAIAPDHRQNRTISKSVERKFQGWGQNRWPERTSGRHRATLWSGCCQGWCQSETAQSQQVWI